MAGNSADRGSRQAASDSATLAHWSHAQVLVVDDHRTYRLLLGAMLEKLGVAYRCCDHGQQALHALDADRFDLVITDCRMPVMDGFAMTRELRRRERAEGRAGIVVLALTAGLGPEDIRQCEACGMNGWLTKPLGLAQLDEVLRCWLNPSQAAAPADKPTGSARVRNIPIPSRASLIETFGTWEVVEPMLLSLLQEAHADLAVLTAAQACLDASLTTQCLHRLVGSVAFLGESGLEDEAIKLINAVHLSGVELNQTALNQLREDINLYLDYLAQL